MNLHKIAMRDWQDEAKIFSVQDRCCLCDFYNARFLSGFPLLYGHGIGCGLCIVRKVVRRFTQGIVQGALDLESCRFYRGRIVEVMAASYGR